MGFFNLSDAFDELKDAFGAKDTAVASAKLLGKAAANVAQYAATTGVDNLVKNKSKAIMDNPNSTFEQYSKAQEAHDWAENRLNERKNNQ
ncbi:MULTISPECIES: hypothetical protein [Enterobacterales]|uniref:hypothetical protein n=1 Tax=Enterobacterales TaxID=91347 RepID=UPI0009BF86D1|nr:hypothetical protein [Edwardsiella ictaluri]ARD39380.1 hypothetical protein B6E78_08350 [Edwardsiella ictaluri]QPW27804.1 hypothetical protein F8538_14240 [Edwardsiella ictaluri]